MNALIALCSRVAEQSALRRYDRELGRRLPSSRRDVELAIYRVAQEALTNAMRHSQAHRGDGLAAPSRTRTLVLDGHGQRPRSATTGLVEGSGLTGMRERAMLIGADLPSITARRRRATSTLRLALAQEQH